MHIMYLYHTGALKLQEMTFEEFIKFERASEFKHEFVSGKVIPLGEINAMAGGTLRHAGLILNIGSALHGHLRNKPCKAFVSDATVKVDQSDDYYYPDIVPRATIRI